MSSLWLAMLAACIDLGVFQQEMAAERGQNLAHLRGELMQKLIRLAENVADQAEAE